MEIQMDYDKLLEMDNESVFEMISKNNSDLGLYNMSLDWRNNKEFILKLKGMYGDLIVYWN